MNYLVFLALSIFFTGYWVGFVMWNAPLNWNALSLVATSFAYAKTIVELAEAERRLAYAVAAQQ